MNIPKALLEIKDLLEQLPSGVDYEAQWDDVTPEDQTAHVGGLIYRIVEDALEGLQKSRTSKGDIE